MIKFQYYSNDATKPKPLGVINLDNFLNTIKNPKKETKELLIKIKEASNDKVLKAKLKTNLYGFTPSAIFKNRRAYIELESFTGLAVLDFDKIDNSVEFKEHLFYTYKSVIACWISPSQKGVKAFVKIPIVETIEQFKEYFYGLASEMEIYNGFDHTSQNASLLLFTSYDKDILIRNDAIEWTIKGEKLNSFDTSKPIIKPQIGITDKQKEWVVNWYTNKINSIIGDGHPQVRDNSVSLGGYVAGGYLSFSEAKSLASYLISMNNYLQKGVNGYQKTAYSSISLGISKPLTFD